MTDHKGVLLEVRENLELGIEALRLRKKLANEWEWDELNDLHLEHQQQILTRLDALIAAVPDELGGSLADVRIYLQEFPEVIEAAQLLHEAITPKETQ